MKTRTALAVLKAFWKVLDYWQLMVLLVGILSGIILFSFRETEFATLFIVTIIAFIASDLLAPFFLRGGKGICQITIFGTHTVDAGYGFWHFS